MSSLERHLCRAISTAKFLLEKEGQVGPPVREEPQQKHIWDAAKKLVVSVPQNEPQQQPDWDPCQSPMGNLSPLGKTQSASKSPSYNTSPSPKACTSPEPQQSSKAGLQGRTSSKTLGLRNDALAPAAQERGVTAAGAFRRSASSTLQGTARQADAGVSGNFRRSASSNMQGTAQQQQDQVAAVRSNSSFVRSRSQLLKHSNSVSEAGSATVQAGDAEAQQSNSSSRPPKGAASQAADNSSSPKSRVSFADEPDATADSGTLNHTHPIKDGSASFTQSAALYTIYSSSGGTNPDLPQQGEDTGLFGNLVAADSALDFLRRIQTDSPSGCYSPSYHRSRSANLPIWESVAGPAAEQPSDFKPLKRNVSEIARPAGSSGYVPPTAASVGYNSPSQLRVDVLIEANSSSPKPGFSPAGSPKEGFRSKPAGTGSSPTLTKVAGRGPTSTAAALASAAAADSVLRHSGSTGHSNATLWPVHGLQQQLSREDVQESGKGIAGTASTAKPRIYSGQRVKPANNHRTGYKTEGLGFEPHDAPVSLLNERVPIAASELDSTRYDKVLGALNREPPATESMHVGNQSHWHGH